MLQHTGVPISVFAVCWGGAGTRAGLGARARAGTGAGRLFVLSRCRWTRARSGARLGARLGAGRGSGWGLAPSWRLLLGSPAGGSGSAPGAVAAPGATLWAGVAAGARAALAVTAGRERERARNYNNVSAFQNKILNLLTVCQTDLKPRKFLNNLWIQPKINKKNLTFCCPQTSSVCDHSVLSHQAWIWHSSCHCGMQTQPPCMKREISGQTVHIRNTKRLNSKNSNSPFVFGGSVSVHKGNFPCFPHQVLQVLFLKA